MKRDTYEAISILYIQGLLSLEQYEALLAKADALFVGTETDHSNPFACQGDY